MASFVRAKVHAVDVRLRRVKRDVDHRLAVPAARACSISRCSQLPARVVLTGGGFSDQRAHSFAARRGSPTRMGSKRHTPEQIAAALRQRDAGTPAVEL
jgi:hypothetical protein